MKSDSDNPLFIYLSFDEGEVLLNLRHIVQVHSITQDELTLEMSDGKTITVHGSESVLRIIALLSQYAIIPEGVPLSDFLSGKNVH